MDDKVERYKKLLKQKEELEKEIDSLDIIGCNLYKATMYFTDTNNYYRDFNEFIAHVQEYTDGIIAVFDEKVTEIKWHDELDINCTNADQYDYDKYF